MRVPNSAHNNLRSRRTRNNIGAPTAIFWITASWIRGRTSVTSLCRDVYSYAHQIHIVYGGCFMSFRRAYVNATAYLKMLGRLAMNLSRDGCTYSISLIWTRSDCPRILIIISSYYLQHVISSPRGRPNYWPKNCWTFT